MTKLELVTLLADLPPDAEIMLNCWPAEQTTGEFDSRGPGIDDLFGIDGVDIHEGDNSHPAFAVINARIQYDTRVQTDYDK